MGPRDDLSTNSQLEKLVGMVETLLLDKRELKQATRELKEDNQELKERVSSLEAGVPGSTRASSRGPASLCGKPPHPNTRSRSRRNAANDSADSCEVIDPALLDNASSVATDTGVTDCDPASDMGEGDDIDLSTKERSTVQAYVTKVFRCYCNVGGNNWLDPNLIRTNPITHETYSTPFFHFDVQDLRNAKIIHEVANVAKIDMNSVWQTVLKRTAKSVQMPNWDLEFFVKDGEERKQKPMLGLTGGVSAASTNQNSRFAGYFTPEYLSDEISEPEDETREAKAAWKVRLAAAAGISLSPAVLERTQILEVLVPPWRTEMYRDILHALSKRWYKSLSNKQKEVIKYNGEWVKQQATDSEMRCILKDWGKYPEPVDLALLLEASRDGVGDEVQ
ncbi:hypothetical protein C8J57DRAFT_1576678 [Mycena rebaudengoi]|nr:hypothetical protein C8J57DRAFT_1576678 [Mycena rebaudengoi]